MESSECVHAGKRNLLFCRKLKGEKKSRRSERWFEPSKAFLLPADCKPKKKFQMKWFTSFDDHFNSAWYRRRIRRMSRKAPEKKNKKNFQEKNLIERNGLFCFFAQCKQACAEDVDVKGKLSFCHISHENHESKHFTMKERYSCQGNTGFSTLFLQVMELAIRFLNFSNLLWRAELKNVKENTFFIKSMKEKVGKQTG